jgi:asparagine synthase (glutamine-hydrolysing)
MCGISGWVDLHGKPDGNSRLRTMMSKLGHRGPDEQGLHQENGVGLGFNRLSIVGGDAGAQPILSEDGRLVLVCNGEIFNHGVLRKELTARGHRFRGTSDAEVIVHLYEESGIRSLDRLNGQFAFALFDSRQQTLILARDRFGICPLYYARAGSLFLFASEIKAILANPEIPREVDLTGLDQLLTFPGLISPRTMFKGISGIPSGHYGIFSLSDRVFSVRKYWDLDFACGEADDEHGSKVKETERVEVLLSRLGDSVAMRLPPGMDTSLYLSGGLDSALLAMLAKSGSSGQIRTYSAAFDSPDFSEAAFQKLAAAKLGSRHREIDIRNDCILGDLRKAVFHSEQPLKETYNTVSLALSRAVRSDGGKVALSGEGADELFAGYVGYKYDKFRRMGQTQNVANEEEGRTRFQLWGDASVPYEYAFVDVRKRKSRFYSRALEADFPNFDCTRERLVDPKMLVGRHPLRQRSYLDFKLRLTDHLVADHGDRMGMANSVELRFPFLDPGVVDAVIGTPPGLLLKGFSEKYLLKAAARRVGVPDEIIAREKFPFHSPSVAHLAYASTASIRDLLDPDRIRKDGYFSASEIESSLSSLRKKGCYGLSLYEMDILTISVTFSIFLEEFKLPSLN